MKKAYTLLLTIVLITIFSILSIFILETKSLRNTNLTNQYLYIQAKNHKNFLKNYINELDLKDITHLKVDDDLFDIFAQIEQKGSISYVDIFVKAKDYNISLYERITKE